MTIWFFAAGALAVSTLPVWLTLVHSDTASRLVAMEVLGVMVSLMFICLAQGFDRTVYSDMSLVLAVMSTIGGLTYARFLERWL